MALWVVLVAALGCGVFLRRLGRAFAGHISPARYAASFVGLWMACAVSLVLVFTVQELLEGVLATGHASGLTGVFAYGGWWSIPASACVGLVLAAILHGARWALDQVTRWGARVATGRRRTTAVPFVIYDGTREQMVKPGKRTRVHLMDMLSDAQTGVAIPNASVRVLTSECVRQCLPTTTIG